MILPQRTRTLPPFAVDDADNGAELHDSRVATILEQPSHDQKTANWVPSPLEGIFIGVIVGAAIWTIVAIGLALAFVG
jgi:hypothetical protein